MKRHVIIGNSGAGISAVQAIRQVSSQDTITLISKENCLAYSPVLLTYYLSGKINYEDLFYCDEAFYRNQNVRIILGHKALKVDPAARQVLIEQGEPVEFDDLLIATGSSPLILPIEGAALPGIFTVNTAEDAVKLVENLRQAAAVAIVGTGLIGMQSLAAVLARGKKVFLIGRREQVLFRILDEEGGSIVEKQLRQAGVELHFKDQVTRITAEGNQKVLSLASGNQIKTDAVIMASGVKANTSLMDGSGVRLGQGIVVDDHCRTNVEGIYAAGDVAESLDALTGKGLINATWPNAIEQGMVAGFNMAGQEKTCRYRPRLNALTLLGLSCASIGSIKAEGDNVREFRQRDNNCYRKLVFQDDVLIGAILFQDLNDAGVLINLIERKIKFSNPEKSLQLPSQASPYIAARWLM